MDVCTTVCGPEDAKCLAFLLRSLREFADLASCDLLVSCNSGDSSVRELVARTCATYAPKSVDIDFFEPTETVDSRQHGESLNRAFARTTSKHVVVADADVIVTSPGWLDFCKRRIDEGCFIVGTPYSRFYRGYKGCVQGDFPNVWCAMIDGDALRAAGLDMRPEVRFDKVTGRWVFCGCDTSGQLWRHAMGCGLRYVSFSDTKGGLSSLLRRSDGNPLALKRVKRAERRLMHLRSLEFCLPGTDKVCCVHLLHAIGHPDRVERWGVCADAIVDAILATSENE